MNYAQYRQAEQQVLKKRKQSPKLGCFTGQPGCWVGRFSTEDTAACSHSSLWHLRSKESHGKGEKKGATCSGAKCSFLSHFRGRGGSRLKLPKDTTSLQNHKNSRPCPRDNHMFNQRRQQQVNAEKTAPSWRKATGKQEAPWPAKYLQSGPHQPEACTSQRPRWSPGLPPPDQTIFPGRLDHTPSSPGQSPRGQRRAHPQVSGAPQTTDPLWGWMDPAAHCTLYGVYI